MIKDPQDVLDYAVDWNRSRDGAPDGTGMLAPSETITDSTWVVQTGLTKEASPAPTSVAGKTTVWISGGIAGQRYEITNHITTSQGRQYDKTISVYVRNR